MREPKGKRLRLTCGYHGWSYSLDGDLKAIKDPEDFDDFDFSCRNLKGIRCECFGKLIFVNFDDDAVPLLEWLGPVAREWEEFQFDKCRLRLKLQLENCHGGEYRGIPCPQCTSCYSRPATGPPTER